MLYRDSEELAESKLLLLYILSEMKMPLSKSEITRIVLENNCMNYFASLQFLGELVEGDFVTCIEYNGRHFYRIEQKGIDILGLFLNRIPQRMKDDINAYLSKNAEQIKKEKQIVGRYTIESENEYLVTLKMMEGNSALLDLSLRVFSHTNAREMCQNWNDNAPALYSRIVNVLLSREDD